jgi:hypothetical protein
MLQDSDSNQENSLESFGVCAVALYDYQVGQKYLGNVLYFLLLACHIIRSIHFRHRMKLKSLLTRDRSSLTLTRLILVGGR